MKKKGEGWLYCASLLGMLGVGMGAFGAHILFDGMTERYQGIYNTASKYALIHAVLLCTLGFFYSGEHRAERIACAAIFGGTCIFSGTLWILSIFGIKWMGAITPIGGIMLLIGWGAIAVWARAMKQERDSSQSGLAINDR